MKNIFIAMVALFAFCLANPLSYAYNSGDCTGNIPLNSDNTTSVDLSANVHAEYKSDGIDYTASTYNSKGSQTYVTGSWTTYIYYKDQTQFPTFNGNSADNSTFSSWDKLGQ